VVRDQFPPAWLSERYAVLRQRWAVTCSSVWGTVAPAGRQGLQTLKGTSRKTRRHWKLLLGIGVVSLLGIILISVGFIVWKVPQWQAAPWKGQMEAKDLARLEIDARTALIQAMGGAVLLLGFLATAIGLVLTWRNLQITQNTALKNFQLTQDRQITEHYTRAVEQLGSDKLELRLGAIYALERIARNSERDHWPIMEILTAYVREHAPWPPKAIPLLADDLSPTEKSPEGKDQPEPKPAPNIQAILTVLGRRTRYFGKGEDQRLDLRRTTLRGAYLREAHLEGAALWQAHLEGAYLREAHLERAYLGEAHLEGADLVKAHLEGADLLETHLEGAYLMRAHLEGAAIEDAHLERAALGEAHLEGAYLGEAHLEGADLGKAHLEGAYLWGAHLEGAALHHAHLEGAYLLEAHLEGAILLSAHLQGVEGLTVEQLSTVKTLYGAELDPPLLAQIQQQYPHLREKPQRSGTLDLTGPIPIFRP
jgi:uncharacterized protein YjbI with pentapeptide repeats